jgi:hypothetical protein
MAKGVPSDAIRLLVDSEVFDLIDVACAAGRPGTLITQQSFPITG